MNGFRDYLTALGEDVIEAARNIRHGRIGLMEVALLLYCWFCLIWLAAVITSAVVN